MSADKSGNHIFLAHELRQKAGQLKLRMQGELLKLQGRFSEALQAEHIALNKKAA